jgi:hypothetical protein
MAQEIANGLIQAAHECRTLSGTDLKGREGIDRRREKTSAEVPTAPAS